LNGKKLGFSFLLVSFLGPSSKHRDDCLTATNVADLSPARTFESRWVGAGEGERPAPVRRRTAPGECAELAIKAVNDR
jgi:hypothetical protein